MAVLLVVRVVMVVVVVVVVVLAVVVVVVVVVVIVVVVEVLVHGTLHMLGQSAFNPVKKLQNSTNPEYFVRHDGSSA